MPRSQAVRPISININNVDISVCQHASNITYMGGGEGEGYMFAKKCEW